MSHIQDEVLAALALGDREPLDESQEQHLRACRVCQDTLAQLDEITTIGRAGREPLLDPEPQLLDQIMADLAQRPVATVRAAPQQGDGERHEPPAVRLASQPPEVVPPRRAATGPRRSSRLVLLAAAVGLFVGVGGTVLVDRLSPPEVDVVASTALTSLPGQTGSGQAELVVEGGIEKLRVSVDTASPGQDYRELWLINTDGERMVSLGVLSTSGRGTYSLPAVLSSGLQDYTIVDVSLEPFDGNAAHSRVSVVRGTLP